MFLKLEQTCEKESMSFKVEILPTAWEDLKRIEDWYLIRFDIETALKVSDHILDAIE